MRLIKLYKEFNINEGFGDFTVSEYDKIESDVNDIFIDLKDNGAKVNIYFYHKGAGRGIGPEDYMIKVNITSDRKFNMDEIEEPARMMVDYFQDLSDRRIYMEYDTEITHQFNAYYVVTIYLIERK
jgi:hypothetical protein